MRRLFSRLPNKLGEHVGWLITSFVLALFVWVAAANEQNPVEARVFPERIDIQILTDDNMIITNSPSRTAEVFLRTQSSVWEVLESDDIIIRADTTGLEAGTHTIELEVELATARRVVVEDWRPRQITVEIDEAAEILAPIELNILSGPPTGFEVTESTFTIQETLVSGPATQVNRVIAAQVRLHLNEQNNPLSDEGRLVAVDNQGRLVSDVTLEPALVNFTVNIQPREDFAEVFVRPNIIGEPPQGYVVQSMTLEPQTVLVSGRPSALEQLPGSILTAEIDLSDQTASFSRVISVSLPAGVILATEQNVTITVEIGTLPGSRNFEALPVQVQGLNPDYNATYALESVNVFITGPAPMINTLIPEDIVVVADLSDLEAGAYEIPLETVINREGLESATITVLPAALDVVITSRFPTQTPTPPLLETTPIPTNATPLAASPTPSGEPAPTATLAAP